MATAPNLIPPFITVSEVTRDRNLRVVLADVLREARKLCEKLDDSLMLMGSEIWMADLTFYQNRAPSGQTRRGGCGYEPPGGEAHPQGSDEGAPRLRRTSLEASTGHP